MFTGNIEFKKVDIELSKTGGKSTREKVVYLKGKKVGDYGKIIYNRVCISSDLIAEAGFENNDRVDLMQCGKMFAFKKSSAGLFTIHVYGKGARMMTIGSANMCIHLMSNTNGCTEYDGWVEDGMIIFKPKEQ